MNLEIQPILGSGNEIWVQPIHLVSSNTAAADAASGDGHNASNGNTEAIASGTTTLMYPDQYQSVPVLGDDGEPTSTTGACRLNPGFVGAIPAQASRVGKVLSWVLERGIADLSAPVSGDGGGLRVDQPMMKTTGVIEKPSAGDPTASMSTARKMGLSMARSRNHVPDSDKAKGHGDDGSSMMGSIVVHSESAPETFRLDGREKGMLVENYDFFYRGHPITTPVKEVGYDSNNGRSLGTIASALQVDAPLSQSMAGALQVDAPLTQSMTGAL